jgi:hypothetical protein
MSKRQGAGVARVGWTLQNWGGNGIHAMGGMEPATEQMGGDTWDRKGVDVTTVACVCTEQRGRIVQQCSSPPTGRPVTNLDIIKLCWLVLL